MLSHLKVGCSQVVFKVFVLHLRDYLIVLEMDLSRSRHWVAKSISKVNASLVLLHLGNAPNFLLL
jgi:hypothetical protein